MRGRCGAGTARDGRWISRQRRGRACEGRPFCLYLDMLLTWQCRTILVARTKNWPLCKSVHYHGDMCVGCYSNHPKFSTCTNKVWRGQGLIYHRNGNSWWGRGRGVRLPSGRPQAAKVYVNPLQLAEPPVQAQTTMVRQAVALPPSDGVIGEAHRSIYCCLAKGSLMVSTV